MSNSKANCRFCGGTGRRKEAGDAICGNCADEREQAGRLAAGLWSLMIILLALVVFGLALGRMQP